MARTRFDAELDVDGLSADEAFAILGDETRVDVLRVLWNADAARVYDDGSDAARTMSYSGLKAAVDVDDNGRFNYHLSRLVPHFVRRTDDGYRLSGAGHRIARTVLAVSGPDDHDVSRDLDADCPLCGGPVEAAFEDQWLRIRCTDCNGLFGDQAPTGTLFLTSFPAAGLSNRDPEETLDTALYRCALDITYLTAGICRECAGRVSSTTTVCEDHDSTAADACSDCGTPFPVWADVRCDACGFAKRLPIEMYATGLAMTVGLFDDAGPLSFEEAVEVLETRVETTTSEDPIRRSVTVRGERTTFAVTFDDDMNVVDRDLRPDPGAESA